MPLKTKITLSDKELSLVKNEDWILTKQLIIHKVTELLAGQEISIQKEITGNKLLPAQLRTSVPKINKGENYRGLPYVILDYPRCFEKEDIFAVRTMFWWGNFFSITLHLAGIYKTFIKEKWYSDSIGEIKGLYVGINKNQWQHHYMEDNYLQYQVLTPDIRTNIFEKNNFIKLSLKYELDDWNNMPAMLMEGYKNIARILFNSRSGETGL